MKRRLMQAWSRLASAANHPALWTLAVALITTGAALHPDAWRIFYAAGWSLVAAMRWAQWSIDRSRRRLLGVLAARAALPISGAEFLDKMRALMPDAFADLDAQLPGDEPTVRDVVQEVVDEALGEARKQGIAIELSVAVVPGADILSVNGHGKLALWCKACGRDAGRHTERCSLATKGSEPEASATTSVEIEVLQGIADGEHRDGKWYAYRVVMFRHFETRGLVEGHGESLRLTQRGQDALVADLRARLSRGTESEKAKVYESAGNGNPSSP